MKDAGILAVRAVGGALLAGHGAQKLFGVLGGPAGTVSAVPSKDTIDT